MNVIERASNPTRSAARFALATVATASLALFAVACGDDSGDDAANGGVTTEAPVGTSAGGGSGDGDPVNGEQLARSMGCAGCHGPDFTGGAGPSLVGLAGSEVLLDDGTTVMADTAYLVRSIADPSAERVADYNLQMPANNLSDAEIDDIVAFIETLTDG